MIFYYQRNSSGVNGCLWYVFVNNLFIAFTSWATDKIENVQLLNNNCISIYGGHVHCSLFSHDFWECMHGLLLHQTYYRKHRHFVNEFIYLDFFFSLTNWNIYIIYGGQPSCVDICRIKIKGVCWGLIGSSSHLKSQLNRLILAAVKQITSV